MFRAVLEGIAFEARASADAIRAVAELPPFERILTIGSSLENRLSAQIKADLHGLPLKINPVRETVSLGAALLAGLGCGVFPDASSAARVARREEISVEPDRKIPSDCRRATNKSIGNFTYTLKRRTIGSMPWLDNLWPISNVFSHKRGRIAVAMDYRTPSAMVVVKIAFEQSLSFWSSCRAQWPADVCHQDQSESWAHLLFCGQGPATDARRGSRSTKKPHLT